MSAKKRIGILTYHHVINEGAILQAYCLYKTLNKHLDDCYVEIIDYRPTNIELRDLKSIFTLKMPQAILSNLKSYIRIKKFIKDNLALSEKRIITNNYNKILGYLKNRYDMIIVGSDEVWKIEKGRFARQFPNIYWLSPELRCKKIACAVSANKTDYNDLSFSQKKWIENSLCDFNIIGVRDDYTLNFIRSLDLYEKNKVFKMPDPSFMLDLNNLDMKSVLIKYGIDFSRPLAGIVLKHSELSKSVCEYLRSNKYQVISLSNYNPQADINLIGKINPFQWAEIYKYFDFCVTTRFHATIFSIRNKTPFLTIDLHKHYRKYESKNYSLLKEFSLLKHYINMRQENVNISDVFNRIDNLKNINNFDIADDNLEKKRDEFNSFAEKVKFILNKNETI